jgi:hypothetical protein
MHTAATLGDPADAPDPAEPPGSNLRVFLITLGPADPVRSRFGHTALWIQNAESGMGKTYEYGLSTRQDMRATFAMLRGQIVSYPGSKDPHGLLTSSAAHNRSAHLLELNLTAAEKLELREILESERQPGSAPRAHDFYRNSCTTAVRDVLDQVLDGRLRATTEPLGTSETYRTLTRRYLLGDPLLDVATMIMLGPRADRPITGWDTMFLPAILRDRLMTVTVGDGNAEPRPLVKSRDTWYEADRAPLPQELPPRWPGWWLVGVLPAAGVTLLGALAHGVPWAPGTIRAVAGGWWSATGVLGIVIASLWWSAADSWASWNENLLQLNPVALVAGVAILSFDTRAARAWTILRWTAVAITFVALAGIVAKLMPGIGQDNHYVLAVTIPVHLGVGYAVWRLSDPNAAELTQASREARECGVEGALAVREA